jgi:hypothetical protein
MASDPEVTFGYSRISLNGLGEGTAFEKVVEIKESEYVTPHDELLGYLTVRFDVTINFVVNLKKVSFRPFPFTHACRTPSCFSEDRI